MKKNKSPFLTGIIRELTLLEREMLFKIKEVMVEESKYLAITKLQDFLSFDKKQRDLIFDPLIAEKIIKDHGSFYLENMVITISDWDYVILNVGGNKDKINFIKVIPETDHFLTIGANRNNGFFIVTHYETEAKNSDKLKNLLKNKGDALDRAGRAVVPSFATSSEEVASQLDLSGVRTDT